MKKTIKNLLIHAKRVHRYRKDVLSDSENKSLESIIERLDVLTFSYKNYGKENLNTELSELDQALKKLGGKIYPKTFWIDNVEMLLVAAIIVIGIRVFFFQPFIIPTNSMYPTYSGMKEFIYPLDQDEPTVIEKIFNTIQLGARSYYLTADRAGRVSVELFSQAQYSRDKILRTRGLVSYNLVQGRKWFGLLPAQFREYSIFVDNHPMRIRVPIDFSLDNVILKTYFNHYDSLQELMQDYHAKGLNDFSKDQRYRLTSNYITEADRPIIAFDIHLGDALFVDRLSYHFIQPKVGDPFVFKAGDVQGHAALVQSLGDKYYIKRLAGIGAEELSIQSHGLFANGNLRNEVPAFLRNAEQSGEYGGYFATGNLSEAQSFVVPDEQFFALGDNSYNSFDSRYWGAVPESFIIGKAFFIYYPFTKRWGVAE